MTAMAPVAEVTPSRSLMDEVRTQRWDDHRFYHQSYINQALHLFSASCFVASYLLLPFHLVAAVWLGGLVALWSRQIGHFFFEKRDYDTINDVTFDKKEELKVGFNLNRKIALFIAWMAGPLALAVPAVGQALAAITHTTSYVDNVAYVWLATGMVGFFGRVLYLTLFRSPKTGLAWFTKILTDPFHDISIYYTAPMHLWRGERFDPIVSPPPRG